MPEDGPSATHLIFLVQLEAVGPRKLSAQTSCKNSDKSSQIQVWSGKERYVQEAPHLGFF